ncbi:Metallo-dependent phosphatase [Rhizopogon vinicolor AM-OR11-026]|uniref:Metallo-dependent phosphatase n=1 Tax=Rhizopogon vinicolor AM-OR11-026 TaxID=1314800 RepID=A0A1B7MIA6_9AGAM|nr:Metallo-dependent phosphatase [Rhizopogon vinicolor AM-OR11-026]
MSKISITHFNDVYRVTPQKFSNTSSETIDVSKFAGLLDSVRAQWENRPDGKKEGLTLFSGDAFSPSMEGSVIRGSHMTAVLNALGIDVAVAGNHDFDYGYPHFCKLTKDSAFPWLLSNIIDENTGRVPVPLQELQVVERRGVRIGLIGLAEKQWIATLPSWPANFQHRDMAQVAIELSKKLRDTNGEYKCDIVLALTHCRLANDIQLAKDAYAFSPSAYDSLPSQHGVDLILGGHDHDEGDSGDILLFKSGTDFREFSDVTIELQDAPEGCVRKKIIQAVHGKRQVTKPDSPSSNELQAVIGSQLSSVQASSNSPVCKSAVELDLGRKSLRGGESSAGNWFADVLRHAYDDSPCMKGEGGSDGVIFCAGTLRGGSVYPPGNITLGNILEILSYEDPVVVLELTGQAIWDVMESTLSRYPAYEGRFPIISGFRVSWDSQRPAGQRVLGIWLQKDVANPKSNGVAVVDGDEIKPDKEGKKYKIVTREYLAQGNDGYSALIGHNYLIDDETGQIMSSIVRKYLLGSHFINRLARLRDSTKLLDSSTAAILSRELEQRKHEADDHKSLIAAK